MSKQITVQAQETQGREIQIKCQGADALPIDTLVDFQGKLKKLSKKNAEKLSRSIEQEFIDPIKVWQHEGFNKIINGHQRLRVLCSLREAGWNIPLIPVDYVYPENEAEAREWVLKLDSQYGEYDDTELKSWLDELDESDKETLRLVDGEISLLLKHKSDYEPNTEPLQANREVNNKDIDKSEEKLDNQFKKEENKIEVICPECGESFFIDLKEFK